MPQHGNRKEVTLVNVKLYVANLTFKMTDRDLQRLFEKYGVVVSAQVARDRDSSRSKGFGFVEMPSEQEAEAAIAGLAGKEIQGRSLIVERYRAREEGAKRPERPRRPTREPRRHAPPLGSRLRRPRPAP